MKRHQWILAVALIGAVLIGAGCAAKTTGSQLPKPAVKTTPKASPKKTPPKDPNTELMEYLNAFRETKSYKTTFRLPTKDGIVKGTLDYVRPDRYQGTTQLNDSPMAQIVIVGKNLYLKVGELRWADMTDTKVGKTLIQNMKNAVQGNAAFNQEQSAKLNVISRQNDELNSCILFTAQLSDAKPDAPPIKICAKNGLPKYFEIETNLGVYHVDFYDYNSIFLIERPM